MGHARRSRLLWVAAAAVLHGCVFTACSRSAPADTSRAEVRTPSPDDGLDALAARRQAQLSAAGNVRAFHDFQFADAIAASGITFVHHIVEDAGKTLQGRALRSRQRNRRR